MNVSPNLITLFYGENSIKRISLFLFAICIFFSQYGFAQVRQSAEIMPQFEGSTNGLKKWLADNIKYPEEAIQNKEEGRVTVNFVVMEDGSIAQPMIANGVSRSLDAEALRLVAAMPKWIPASQDGQPCAVEYSLPIRFKLPTAPQQEPSQPVRASKPQRKEWKLLPNHKMYEGPFEAFGLYEKDGNAKYQYIEKYDGTRVFDGPFEYRGTDFEVHGQFKNDYQDGGWTFTSGGKTTSIYFSSNGQPSSHFVLYDIVFEYLLYPDGRRVRKASLRGPAFSGNIDNHSKTYSFCNITSTTSKGYEVTYWYYWDLEDGKWHERRNDGEIKGRKDIKWDKYRGFYRIDSRTGERIFDIKLGNGNPDPQLAIIRMNAYLLRKTKRDYWR